MNIEDTEKNKDDWKIKELTKVTIKVWKESERIEYLLRVPTWRREKNDGKWK